MQKMIQVISAAATLCIAGLVGVVTSAHADTTVSSTEELVRSQPAMQYVFSERAMLVMYQLGVEEDKRFNLQTDCKSKYQVRPLGAVVLKPVTIPDGGRNPKSGAWLTRYQLERCGDAKTYNAVFVADAEGGNPKPTPFYPGNTRGGPVLVQDAMMVAVSTAIAKSGQSGCRKVEAFDMRAKQPPHDVVEGGATFRGVWKETWTFRVCGKMVDVDMIFTPDAVGSGTSFRTESVKTTQGMAQ
ncbi:hypothetical protein UC34_03880 [Pandoraea vervacti]|uniref:PknH-like extracellular domain-containing protein n=1 Tax=Pandoraea vervacti TaxID=656178 RepID=A0ABN4FMQ7_9BURK|nr:hypothetical protein [Pandoraea vervacti]AJP56372.1 hypothetical protein UC34_03880 [Pandoraea vervacti]